MLRSNPLREGLAATQEHGKKVAMLVDSLDEAERWIGEGVALITYSSDAAVLHSGYHQAVARLRGSRG